MAKRFKQFRLNCGSGQSNIGFNEAQYSNNILQIETSASVVKSIAVYEIAIYALPGTRFKANAQNLSGEDWEFTVNALGIFQMEMADNPITSLCVYSPTGSQEDLGPIIIDVICQEGESE